MSEHTETQISSRKVYDGHIVHLYVDEVRLENGKTAVREVIRHQGAVCVVPLCADGDVLLVRQFRYPFGTVLLEAPAGKIDPGEDIFAAAKRELSEETGSAAAELTYLGAYYPSVAYLDEVIHLFAARGLSEGDMHLDDDEFLDVVRMPLKTAVNMTLAGQIPDGKTQAALLRVYLQEREQNKA